MSKHAKILSCFTALFLFTLHLGLFAQTAPRWVNNLDGAFPGHEWIAVAAQGNSRPQAESSAMNMLARAFKTNVESLTQASQQFSQIVINASDSKNINFAESRNFSQEINVSANVHGLIGVMIDVYREKNGTVHVCARMNRRECAARYSGMIRENSNVINSLLSAAVLPGTFETYARLSFAYSLAQVTDNFQNILEVLDPSAVNRKPGYGGANSIKTKMLECASLINIGVEVTTEQAADRTLFTRAAGSFFRDRGFKIIELPTNSQPKTESSQTTGSDYVLRANIRFEAISQNVISCRYYLDAALENKNGTAVFSFTENDRKAHHNSQAEARRIAVQAVEMSIKEGKFAKEFDSWLNLFLN
jgi:hypothetical protein